MLQYNFQGKNALVTGSSKGIGRAVALSLARGGANVMLNCSGSRTLAEQTASEIRELGVRGEVAVCDVSDQSAVEAMVQRTAAEFGSVDLFVSNAVYSDRDLLVKADMQGFRRTIEVSMWGALYGVRAAAQQMLKQASRGRIPSSVRPTQSFRSRPPWPTTWQRLPLTTWRELLPLNLSAKAFASMCFTQAGSTRLENGNSSPRNNSPKVPPVSPWEDSAALKRWPTAYALRSVTKPSI